MIIVPYDLRWPLEFTALRELYFSALGALVERVEHIGSTSVPGLSAKPILDIDLVMKDYSIFPKMVTALGSLGYTHNGDQGIPGREAFKPIDSETPHTHPRRIWGEHHLYVCPSDSRELARHCRFRDTLRARADLRAEYEALKINLARRANDDRKKYAQLKEIEASALVERILLVPYRNSGVE